MCSDRLSSCFPNALYSVCYKLQLLLEGNTGKAANAGPCAGVTATHLGDLDEIPHSWLWPGPALAVGHICGVNSQVEELCVL